MMPRVETILDLLSENSWKGFPEIRHYLWEAGTRAYRRALASLVAEPKVRSRPDFEQRLIRVAIVGSYSTDNLRDHITLQFLDRGLFCEQYHAAFGQMGRELRDPDSGLYRMCPDVVVLIPDPGDHLPAGVARSEASASALVEAVCEDIARLRVRFSGPVLVQNFVCPEQQPLGILDSKQRPGVADFYRLADYSLSQRLSDEPDVFVLDAAHLATFSAVPWTRLHKPNFLAGCPMPDELGERVAAEIAAAGAALKGFVRKCLVVDLDNTLWAGVVGEDGVAGLQLTGSFPGNVYAALRRQIMSLRERGIILAINSKNNEQDVREVFDARPEMELRLEHFSAVRINWCDKASNLRDIAKELNIGLDAMMILDDDPAERQWIETSCPEAYVLPSGDPLQMLRFLATTHIFDNLSANHEDVLRVRSYTAKEARKRLELETQDLQEFLRSLQVEVAAGVPNDAQLGRVAQLTQKTNQFNLTTRRYSESQLRRMMSDGDFRIFCCSCRDRFADEGIVGVAIVRVRSEVWEIDTFLLSCRILGRGVERAFLASLCSMAERAGARRIEGEYIASAKNGQTRTFYSDNGFAVATQRDSACVWELQLPAARGIWPEWVSDVSEAKV